MAGLTSSTKFGHRRASPAQTFGAVSTFARSRRSRISGVFSLTCQHHRSNRIDRGWHSGAGLRRLQLHEGDSRGEHRARRDFGRREAERQYPDLGGCWRDRHWWRAPALGQTEELATGLQPGSTVHDLDLASGSAHRGELSDSWVAAVVTPCSQRDCQLNSTAQILGQDAEIRSSNRSRPDRIRPRPEEPECRPADHVSLKIERVVDRSMRRQKPLSGLSGLEPEHLSLSSSDRQMRVLGAVVLAQATWAMNI